MLDARHPDLSLHRLPSLAENDRRLMLSLEAIAYKTELTGNPEHRRILKEGFLGSLPKGDDPNGFGKEFGQTTFFAPFALRALEERKP